MKKDNLATKIILALNWLVGVLLFRILNWTRVYKNSRLSKKTGVIFVASHFTMVDSWLIGTCFNLFDIIFRTKIIPFNVPERKNFYKFRIVRWWLDHSKCIPIIRKTGGKDAHQKIIEIIKSGSSNVLIFPESTRRRKDTLIKISDSVGKLITNCQPQKIVPIKLIGLPYKGSFLPVLFRPLKVIIGNPLNIPELQTANDRDGWYNVAKKVFEGIENLNLDDFEK